MNSPWKFTRNLIHFPFPALQINFFNYWQASQEEGKPRNSQSIRYISPLNFACTDDYRQSQKAENSVWRLSAIFRALNSTLRGELWFY